MIKNKILYAMFFILLIFCDHFVFAQGTGEIFERGLASYRAGNYEAALDDFVLVSLLDQNNKSALKYAEESRKRLFEQKSRQLTGATDTTPATRKIVQPVKNKRVLAAIERRLRQAADAYSAGRIPAAVRLWEEVIEIEPENAEASRSISIANSTVKSLEQERNIAVEEFRAKTIVSASVRKKLDEASAKYSIGDIDGAIKTWKQAISLMPDNQEAKRSVQIAELSRKHLGQDRKKMISEELKRLEKLADEEGTKGREKVVEDKLKKAEEFYNYGDVKKAISMWRDVLSLQPSNIEASRRLELAVQIEAILKKTRSSHKKKDWLKANDGFLRILEIDPECAFALKYLQGIETELKRIVDKEPGTRRAYYAEGFFFYNQKKWTDAINSWKIAMALTTGSKKFSLSESEIHDYISRASTNIEKERIAAMPPKPVRKPSAKPAAKPGKQEPKPVKVEVDVDKSNEYYNQGLMLFSEGKIRDAVLSWELALRYNPDNHKATRNIIRAKKILEK